MHRGAHGGREPLGWRSKSSRVEGAADTETLNAAASSGPHPSLPVAARRLPCLIAALTAFGGHPSYMHQAVDVDAGRMRSAPGDNVANTQSAPWKEEV